MDAHATTPDEPTRLLLRLLGALGPDGRRLALGRLADDADQSDLLALVGLEARRRADGRVGGHDNLRYHVADVFREAGLRPASAGHGGGPHA